MARIRSIKPAFWDDIKLSKISRDVRLLFIGIWSFADDLGVIIAEPALLKARIFPYDEITIPQLEKWLSDLLKFKFIVLIEHKGERFFAICNFAKHQKIDKPNHCDVNIPKELLPKILESSNDLRTVVDESSTNLGSIAGGEDRIGGERKGEERKDFGEQSGMGQKSFLVAEMHKIWVSSFPTYTTNIELDYPALKNIADFIFTQAGTKNGFGNSDNEIKCLNTFQLIADQVNRETFWLNKPLKTISSHIQEFYNKIKNPINGTGKSKSGNGKLDEGLLKEKLAQRIREQQQNGT